MNEYELRQERRRERYQDLAEKAKRESDRAFDTSSNMASIIPFGQPILVGHHSEKRDRNYRARIGRKMDQAVRLQKKANYYAQRAASVGQSGISSDDPDAIVKLQEEIAEAEKRQTFMREVNKLVRKNDRAGLAAKGIKEKTIDALMQGDYLGRKGFADYELQNNNANIRRMKARVTELGYIKQRTDKEEITEHYHYCEDTTENRVMFFFSGKPDEKIRACLKSWGFKWSPTRGAWVRQLNGNGLYAAKNAREQMEVIRNA